MYSRITYFLLVVIVSLAKVQAQTPKAFEQAADNALLSNDYYAGMKYFDKVLEMEPERTDILFKHAEAARKFQAFTIAEQSYQKVLSNNTNGAFDAAIFGLGVTKQSLGKYEEARTLLNDYLTKSNNPTELANIAAKSIEDCEWAIDQMTHPEVGVLLERLSDGINTTHIDIGAVKRGDTLYYGTFRDEKWKGSGYPARPILRIMEAIDGKVPAVSTLSIEDRHSIYTAFTPDGQFLITNQCDFENQENANLTCKLYYRKKDAANNWSTPVELSNLINAPNATSTQPHIALEDGGYFLYFMSDRTGGKGKMDIWKAKFDLAGNFDAPVNLTINTPEDDITPYYDNKSKILYFSTNGRRTLGGFDIYRSEFKDLQWTEPEHMGTPFNSSMNDINFVLNGYEAYFSSNRNSSAYLTDEACCYDIYKATYLDLKLDVYAFSKISGDPLSNVIFTLGIKEVDDQPISKYSADLNNTVFEVKRQKLYYVIATKEGYLPDTLGLLTDVIPTNRIFTGKLYLEPQDLALGVLTFNQLSKSPLPGVSIRLLEMKGITKAEKNTAETNEADLKVKAATPYMIIADKLGYLSDTALVTESELKFGQKTMKNLYLTPGSLNSFLPIYLYYDNDKPDSRSRLETTATSYGDTYDAYINRKPVFVTENTDQLTGEMKIIAEQRIQKFFEDDVKGGFLKLETFTDNLDLFLNNNYTVEIMVKGFASPLASNDYNMALTSRRIACVLNHFRKVRGGLFDSYLREGKLLVTRAPFGENTSPISISDSPRNRRHSVYSVEASKERRAEIIEIRLSRTKP